ncbi:hypothetical protein RFI_06690, partial [Reticulomyxa filosa]
KEEERRKKKKKKEGTHITQFCTFTFANSDVFLVRTSRMDIPWKEKMDIPRQMNIQTAEHEVEEEPDTVGLDMREAADSKAKSRMPFSEASNTNSDAMLRNCRDNIAFEVKSDEWRIAFDTRSTKYKHLWKLAFKDAQVHSIFFFSLISGYTKQTNKNRKRKYIYIYSNHLFVLFYVLSSN